MSHNEESTTNYAGFMRKEDTESVAISEKKQKKSRKIVKSVRPEEFKALIQVIPSDDYKARIAFLLAYGAGLRISEVLRSDKSHFKNTSLFIPESKYGVERVTPVPKGWKEGFFAYLPLKTTSRSLQRKFKAYAKKAGLPEHYSFHSLRHGFATRALEAGIPLNQVQVLLGHSNIATTSVYTKANPIDALKNYEELF